MRTVTYYTKEDLEERANEFLPPDCTLVKWEVESGVSTRLCVHYKAAGKDGIFVDFVSL